MLRAPVIPTDAHFVVSLGQSGTDTIIKLTYLTNANTITSQTLISGTKVTKNLLSPPYLNSLNITHGMVSSSPDTPMIWIKEPYSSMTLAQSPQMHTLLIDSRLQPQPLLGI